MPIGTQPWIICPAPRSNSGPLKGTHPGLVGKVRHHTAGKQNVYCFYGVFDPRSTHVDPKNYGSKPTCVLISDVPEFLRRLLRG